MALDHDRFFQIIVVYLVVGSPLVPLSQHPVFANFDPERLRSTLDQSVSIRLLHSKSETTFHHGSIGEVDDLGSGVPGVSQACYCTILASRQAWMDDQWCHLHPIEHQSVGGHVEFELGRVNDFHHRENQQHRYR